MSRWDCYSACTGHLIELKSRNAHYDSLIIEFKKWSALLDRCSDYESIPMYINSTPKGVYRFNLRQQNIVWENKELRHTTNFGENNKVLKKIGLLYISNSEKL
jgi:Fe-S-cluster-containing hydrogenase component 2